ncbi:unnamed protein product [Rotaria sp. Silwood1]|nr:unnamed protein product [Rotaria sp. Silwood1]CAF4909646.1 unnamed protein product [Rotaria sp. Silwood1]CAF5082867.1 unnamed protein product [Rotaria sp. Silwood1]
MSNKVLSSLNESSIRIDMTPPIRRVTADALSSISQDNISSNEQININTNVSYPLISKRKTTRNSYNLIKQSINKSNYQSTAVSRERSTSSSSTLSSSSKASNNHSLRSSADPSINQDDDDDDDASSNDDTNHQWSFDQHPLNIQLRQLMTRDSLSLSNGSRIGPISVSECKICLEELSIEPLSCCSSLICSKCIYLHLSSNIREARIRILCPSCPHIFTREEILSLLSIYDHNGNLAELYKRFYADINGQAHIKTCPRCCSIKEIDKRLFEGVRWKKKIPRRVICNECQFEWCFYCHAPWHEKMTCKEYREGEKMLRLWASQVDQNQHNAQKCPRCKIYISRNGGCPHMVCSKCQCDFCYNCGRRRFGMKFLGSHESRFSPLGCKYNLYPDKPLLRHTVRGLVAGAATLALPVAAVGAVALLAIGTTIGAPTYGTYRLVKHIRTKRQERRRKYRMETISRQWTTSDSLSTYVNGADDQNTETDDIQIAVQASLITYREEIARREQSEITSDPSRHRNRFNQNDDDDDDDDDDSLY